MSEGFTPEQVTDRLYAAGLTRMAQRVGGCWPSGYRSGMPECLRDLEDMRYAEADFTPAQPSTRAVTLADEVDEWIFRLPPWGRQREATAVEIRLRKIVLDRMLCDPRSGRPIHSWRKLADRHGVSHSWAKTVWCEGIDRLTVIANRPCPMTVARIQRFSADVDRRRVGILEAA